jgi:O-antigen ligase
VAALRASQAGPGLGVASGRLAALLFLLLFAAWPARVFLLSPDVHPGVKLAWLAALAAGAAAPHAGTLLLLGAPLLPVFAERLDGVPAGIIHLLVLSQALPWLARVALGRERVALDTVSPWLAALLLAGAASMLVRIAALGAGFYSAADTASALHQLGTEYIFVPPGPGLANILMALSTFADGALAYLLVRRLPPEWTARLLRGVAGVAVLVAAAGIVQSRTRWGLQEFWLHVDPAIVRVNATFTDPNTLASYFALTLPLVVALAMASSTARARLLWLGGAALGGVALLQTAGRMGYAGAFVGWLVLLGGALRLGLDRRDPLPLVRHGLRRLVLVGGLCAALFIAAVTAVGTIADIRHADQRSYLHTVLYTANLRAPFDERMKGRLAIWRAVGMMIADRPIFGAGVGTVYAEFPPYGAKAEAFDGTLRMSAHNTFLNVAAELGIVGLLIWCGLLAAALAAAFRGLSAGDRQGTWARLGIASGLVGYVSTMLTGDRAILREDLVMLMTIVALAVTMAPSAVWRWPAARRLAAAGLLALAASVPVRLVAEQRRVPLEQVSWGFHPPETIGGVPFRWTTRRAVFYVPASRAGLELSVRSLAPFPQTVDIVFDGRPADRLRLVDHNWVDQHYLLPRRRPDREYHRVELHVTPPWHPRDDSRELGVMVASRE